MSPVALRMHSVHNNLVKSLGCDLGEEKSCLRSETSFAPTNSTLPQPELIKHAILGEEALRRISEAQASIDQLMEDSQVSKSEPSLSLSKFFFQIPSMNSSGVSGTSMDVFLWCPEVLCGHHGLQSMPCPQCGRVGDSVQPVGWGVDSSVVYKLGDRTQCLLSKEYHCTICSTSFRGWHPSCVALMPETISCLFPLGKSVHGTSMEKVLSSTSSHLSKEDLFAEGLNFGECDFDKMLWDNLNEFPLSEATLSLMGEDSFSDRGNDYSICPSEGTPMNDDDLLDATVFLEKGLSGDSFPSSSALIEDEDNSRTPITEVSSTAAPLVSNFKVENPELLSTVVSDPSDTSMAAASLSESKRSIQFCSVCFGIRRNKGKLVDGHKGDGFCPVKGRRASPEEKRELRRRRQKMRRAVSKCKETSFT